MFSANKNQSGDVTPEAESKALGSETLAAPLPDADALLLASSFLNSKDFARTKQALGHLLYPEGLFHNAHAFHKISAAGQLLKATEYADYDQVEKLIADKSKLGLMFEPVSFKFRDGSEERISPLRYAFKVYDTYMWEKVFLKRIEEIEDPVEREACLEKFFAQMKEQEQAGHIDLEPLIQAYQDYNLRYHRQLIDGISDQAIDSMWYQLGKKQKALLPVHMLKEFSREGNTWNTTASFGVDCMLRPSNCRIYNEIVGDFQSLASVLSDAAWGTSFALERGPDADAAWGLRRGVRNGGWSGLIDPAVFRRLFQVRSEEFADQLSLMRQKALESQETRSEGGCCKPSHPTA